MHYSVLLNEVIENLAIKEDGVYVDATVGYAGHSQEILKRLKRGFLFAFDADQEAIDFAQRRLSEISSNFKIFHDNFSNLKENLNGENITLVDGFLFDLGVSSPQIDNSERGFSFMREGSLDMRMDNTKEKSAYEVVNNYSQEELIEIFFKYGEEKLSKVIARKIVFYRQDKKIETTTELVEVIKMAVGAKYFNEKHPERQIFQAIRIEVNEELKVIEKALPEAIKMLKPGGRICVITFHSLEDRIVKQIFKKYSEIDEMVKGLPVIPDEYKPLINLINKKPILPSNKELNENRRSNSAKLRVIERV
ncbi:MAG: 16S rRNA (cytosine(1402)-N(4))-methyltransferase RsmH [Bacilli bacterium]|nr:16S rRNA (cytosine(1402)-N(4))-methyltransferase RsmH [Bacilli bacterium]